MVFVKIVHRLGELLINAFMILLMGSYFLHCGRKESSHFNMFAMDIRNPFTNGTIEISRICSIWELWV